MEWRFSFLLFADQMQISLRCVVCNHSHSGYDFANCIPKNEYAIRHLCTFATFDLEDFHEQRRTTVSE